MSNRLSEPEGDDSRTWMNVYGARQRSLFSLTSNLADFVGSEELEVRVSDERELVAKSPDHASHMKDGSPQPGIGLAFDDKL